MLVKTCGGDDDPDKREGWEQRPERDCDGDLWDGIIMIFMILTPMRIIMIVIMKMIMTIMIITMMTRIWNSREGR